MQLFRDVRFDWIEPQGRRRDAGEVEYVIRGDDVGLAKDRIAKRDIDAEALTVELSGQAALGAEALAFVLHPIVFDDRMLGIGIHFEGHEVAEVLLACMLEGRKELVR